MAAETWSVFVILILGGVFLFAEGICPSAFNKLSPTHTMCLTDKGKNIAVSEAVKQAVVQRHNEIRSQVSPTASNMQKLVWDDSLAEVAAKWARQCPSDDKPHDEDKNRVLPGMPGVYIGQNWAGGQKDLMEATNGWYSEIKDFTWGVPTSKMVGHYTQQIWDDTGRIGCGIADCTGFGFYGQHFVCNYAAGGNIKSPERDSFQTYTIGTSCSACPGKCDGKLCACGGLVCYNGGSVNVATCSCKCPNIYSGTNCQIKTCPSNDPEYCPSYLSMNAKACQDYTNVPAECPYMCKVCP